MLRHVAIPANLTDMTANEISPEELLQEAKSKHPRQSLKPHRETIVTLRLKGYTWREIAHFLREGGVNTDHTKVFRFIKNTGGIAMRIPTADEYVKTFSDINDKIDNKQRAMLRYHYETHNRTVTYRELDQAGGYKTPESNLRYGALGELLGRKLGMQFAPLNADALFYSSAIHSLSDCRSPTGEYQFIMHHEVAKALDRLGPAFLVPSGSSSD